MVATDVTCSDSDDGSTKVGPEVLPKPNRHMYHIHELQNRFKGIPPTPDFAGHRELTGKGDERIISNKGSVRGYRNRVRAGVVTFLDRFSEEKNYPLLEKGKVVIYTTSMTAIRAVYERCKTMKMILFTHMVQFEERDLCMSIENQVELMERTQSVDITLPHLFTNGQYLGNLETVVELNETGDLRKVFSNFAHVTVRSHCAVCGGYSYVPCFLCHGSKKSFRRNEFTHEFTSLRCITCDDSGLMKCEACVAQ